MRKTEILAVVAAAAVLLGGCAGKVKIKEKELRLSLGQEKQLTVTGAKEVSFSSADTNIATVDENGVVKALGNGITVISAVTDKSYANMPVIVGNGVAMYIDENGNSVPSLVGQPVDESIITKESNITALKVSIKGGGTEDITISADKSYELIIEKTPSDSTDKVTIKVADSSVARVDGKTLKGVSRGKTVLTVTAPNGVSAEMIVRVK